MLITDDIRAITENVISLSLLQVANYLLPLILLPYLVRVLEPEKYGLVMFALAFIQYFVILTDYGFNLSATRAISVHRENMQKVSEIFSAVISIKSLILIFCFLMMAIIVTLFDKFSREMAIYYLTFGIVIGNMLFPVWFFQGMEKMRYITILTVLAKAIFTLCIFIFVKEVEDYILVPLFHSLGFIVSGVLAFRIVMKRYGVALQLPSLQALRVQLREGWHIFISTVAINSYLLSNTFLLGLFESDAVVGYYAAGEKLVRSLTYLFLPLFQALYPYVSRRAADSPDAVAGLLKKLLLIVAGITSLIFVAVFAFSPDIASIVLGDRFHASVDIIKILSPLLVVIPIAYVLFNLAMLSFGLDRYYSRIYLFGAFFNLTLIGVFLVIMKWGATGVAVANLSNEIVITVIAVFILRWKRAELFHKS